MISISLLSTSRILVVESLEFAEESFELFSYCLAHEFTFNDVNMLTYHSVVETMLTDVDVYSVWFLFNMQLICFGGVASTRVFNMKDRVETQYRRGSVTGI